jgi:di/tricarboxylate transporter
MAGWLIQPEFDPSQTRTVKKIALANVVGVALLMALVVFIQLEIQNDLKPFIIAADAIFIGAIGRVVWVFAPLNQNSLQTMPRLNATDFKASSKTF